jgi:26S proteasome regulatory subunit N12
MTMTDPQALINNLSAALQANDIASGKVALTQLKIWMLEISQEGSPEATNLAAMALELGALLSVADDDLDAFARNISQLKPYYDTLSATTERKCHVLGLNLMHLLVDNRLSEFHAELELLSEEEAGTPFVSFPITLERQLMVGSYDEVLNAGANVPDPSYNFFMENLIETVRDSIADCVEVTYKSLKLTDAVTMMKLDSVEELQEYVQDKRDDWIVEGDMLTFQPPPVGSKAADIPSMKLISQSLSYATELERIV